ncbi:hypothetical protein ACFXPA_38150 [Amycolatopsis sp. NPDC059090]|uniref:hypothetical protein n=1 Tax=Amycolatopsis sp. NPDC059090 TaxID=3346723 RepID=UPI00366D5CEE
MQAYVRVLHCWQVPLDCSARDELLDRIRRGRIPIWHSVIESANQVQAQFEFWWLNLWDILHSVYAGEPGLILSADDLARRAENVGGTPEMSSFTSEEMEKAAAGFSPYRAEETPWSYSDVIRDHFLPSLIRVETNFQGLGARYSSRPRTDGSDVHESIMMRQCLAVNREGGGPVDLIYETVIKLLDWQESNAPHGRNHVTYRALVDAYNRCHPNSPVLALHR